jgi:hypothetical protein
MKMKNGLLILIAASALLAEKPTMALVFPDQEVGGANDEESPDALSRFGGIQGRRESRNVVLPPISESSFGSGGRSPASEGSRGPAGVAAPKKAVIRDLKRKKAYQEVAVIANDLGFFPNTIFLTEGVSVRLFLTGASARSQCFILDQFGIRRQVRSQKVEEVTFTPDQAGRFTFNCPMNGAKGTFVVRELESGERAPASARSGSEEESQRQ